MNGKQFIKKYFLNSIVFAFWGASLMIVYKYVGQGMQKEINEMYFESITPKSMMYLLISEVFLVGLLLLVFGPNDQERMIRDFCYKYAILPITEFGISFSSVTFGMIIGFTAVVFGFGYIKQGAVLLSISVLIAVYGILSWGMLKFAYEKPKDNVSSQNVRLCGLLFIIASSLMMYVAVVIFNKSIQ